MADAVLHCSRCRKDFSAREVIWSCPDCGSMLEMVPSPHISDPRRRTRLLEAAVEAGHPPGIWRFGPMMQVDATRPVSLGEGNTPVVKLENLGRRMGIPHLHAKLEYLAPTGSFKDRGTSAMVTQARALGVGRIVEDSSGNAGASFAAYCAAAGMAATIFVPASAPRAKKAQIACYGAEVVEVQGSREAVTEAAMARCRQEDGAYYASHNWNPFFLEGTKTFAYEVAAQFDFDPPEHVIMPVGNGSLFLGAWRGFGELRGMGLLERIPKLSIAQAQGCMPIVDAHRRGLDKPVAIPTSPTVAGGISIARPSRGALILRAIRESGGSGAAVTDAEILEYQRALASTDGILCEPTSAAAVAALAHLARRGFFGRDERVLVAITGSGLKDPGALEMR